MDLQQSILVEARKWQSLNIKTSALKVEMEHGSKKLFRRLIPLPNDLLESQEALPDGFNFLAVNLTDSGLVCLDVEFKPSGSVECFSRFLQETGISLESLLMERSLNGGLHIYFRTGPKKINTQHLMAHGGFHYDVLTHRRSFTAPSTFRDKRYEWIGSGLSGISRFGDIPIFPDSFDLLLDPSKKWKSNDI